LVAPHPRSGLALWLACLITAVVVPLLLTGPVPAIEQSSGTADNRGVTELSRRLDHLEARIESLHLEAYVEPPARPLRSVSEQLAHDVESPEVDSLRELLDRLRRLESFENERQKVLASRAAEQARKVERDRLTQVLRREQAHAVILDPTTGDLAKAHAWRSLLDVDELAWNDAVILEMTRLGAESGNDRAREVAWIGADGKHTSPLMVEPLMRALTSDPIANVREEAADALGHYGDHPGVLAVLRAASEGDADAKVREEARRVFLHLMNG